MVRWLHVGGRNKVTNTSLANDDDAGGDQGGQAVACFKWVSCFAYPSTLKMEETCSFETSIDFEQKIELFFEFTFIAILEMVPRFTSEPVFVYTRAIQSILGLHY
jgi:hypothetical protein